VLHALVSDLQGKRVVRGSIVIGAQSAITAGRALAATMRSEGATEILASMRESSAKIPSPQPE
jgi:TPP-dependent pyruvate/acetoin dehydrogenase alpha subunit